MSVTERERRAVSLRRLRLVLAHSGVEDSATVEV